MTVFTNRGRVIRFCDPRVRAPRAASTFTIKGQVEVKQLTESLPSGLNQLGAAAPAHGLPPTTGGEEEEEAAGGVERFDETSKKEAN